MAGESFTAMELSFAKIAQATFQRTLVLQRLPNSSEDQTDEGGFPKEGPTNYTDIDPTHPIPAQLVAQIGKEIVLANQQRSVTPYKVTIPVLYKSINDEGGEGFVRVDFSEEYRAHILKKGPLPEIFLQVYHGGGDDPSPDITFLAYLTQNTI